MAHDTAARASFYDFEKCTNINSYRVSGGAAGFSFLPVFFSFLLGFSLGFLLVFFGFSFGFSLGFPWVFLGFSLGFPEVFDLRKPKENYKKTIRKL